MGSRRRRRADDPLIATELAAVERVIARTVGDVAIAPAFARQLFSPRSKRLRPALVLLSARFGSRQPGSRALLDAAAAAELVHQATLCHDDIVDAAELRRGDVTVQNEYGAAAAAFAGSDLLYASATLCVDLPVNLRHAVGRTGEALCQGQLQEVAMLGDSTITRQERLRIMRLKTASLFRLAAHLGASLGRTSQTVRAALVRFAHWYGMTFQLVDDLRDLRATTATLGRPPGSDLRDGVYTLPTIYALSAPTRDGDTLRATLPTVLRDGNDGINVATATLLIARAGGFHRAALDVDAWLAAARTSVMMVRTETTAAPAMALERMLASLQAAARDVDADPGGCGAAAFHRATQHSFPA